jgi:hypothetical protein
MRLAKHLKFFITGQRETTTIVFSINNSQLEMPKEHFRSFSMRMISRANRRGRSLKHCIQIKRKRLKIIMKF